MANIKGDIKKWKRGELAGNISLAFCAAVLVYFIVCFTVSRVYDDGTLNLITLISAPPLMVLGIAVAAFCNLKFGGAIERAIRQYVLEVCVENAAAFHPERDALSFYLTITDKSAAIQINGYKEKVTFDFSALGKLSAARKVAILTEIENRLCVTFCRLYDRGAKYREVAWAERAGTRRKSGKTVYIIKDGEPDVKAYKTYLKNK